MYAVYSGRERGREGDWREGGRGREGGRERERERQTDSVREKEQRHI